MIELRPYQQEAIQATAAAYKRGVRRPLISLPTGTGKTVVFSTIAQGAVGKGRRTLILAHRDELLQQAQDKLLTTAPQLEGEIGMVKAERNEYGAPVTIASVQSLHKRRLDKIATEWEQRGDAPVWDLVIVDEAHHSAAASYQRILERIGSLEDETRVLTLGVTATPQRSDAKDLGETWEEIVYHRDMLSMMRDGYLCDLRGIQVILQDFDLSEVKVSGGDYQDGDSAARLMEAEAPVHVCGAWRVHAADRKTIIFTPTIALAHEMAHEFKHHGIRAAALSGETPMTERRDMLRRFATGEIQVIANAQVLTEGFDEPSVSCIIIARPTKSQVLYTQMIGRGTRTYPGKQDCLIIDTVGATERLDLQTVPKLFGLGEEASGEGKPEQTVLQMDGVRQERLAREGKIVARQVELFNRQAIQWVLARPGTWAMDIGEETLILQVDGATNTWGFYVVKGRGRQCLASGLDLGYAMGQAEDYARRSPGQAMKLISKDAGWRGRLPSEGQIKILTQWGIPTAGLTRGEASDHITARVAQRAMRTRSRV